MLLTEYCAMQEPIVI